MPEHTLNCLSMVISDCVEQRKAAELLSSFCCFAPVAVVVGADTGGSRYLQTPG